MKTKQYTYFIVMLGLSMTVPAICKSEAIAIIKQQTGAKDDSKLVCLGINLENKK
jgi:hypothetical protein